MNRDKIIKVIKRDESYGIDEFYCTITDELDAFRTDIKYIDCNYKDIMRSYIMIPELICNKWLIPIRVPGATRGHIEVIDNNGYWEIVKVELYDSTAITGVSIIGCYSPEVLNILDHFKEIKIDFNEFNPNSNYWRK